ncbi:unnamed protein product (mitochondrion) [Plasmodiophora brassicae]|uniref:Dephospho-CoA kinase n=1 Tax=Plasmodiophora brassicae TaxID=37360 RepID=A0A0G4IL65_PLABS|nr:hypothetical protein PBRA_004603 [Plasmodiophora brassicae]SPQ93539.1 unnamed protein product [Plasmodiophora brassicae]
MLSWAGSAVLAAIAAAASVALRRYMGLVVVGVTGGIACGKSTFCRELAKGGAAVIDLDDIAHELQLPGTDVWTRILRVFAGSDPDKRMALLDPDTGAIHRPALATIVFNDPDKLRQLSAMMRVPVLKKLLKRIASCFLLQGHSVVFIEAPLLFESGLFRICDYVVAVDCDEADQIRYVCQRGQCTEAEAKQKIASQMPPSEKVRRADVVVRNQTSIDALRREARSLTIPAWSAIVPTRASVAVGLATFTALLASFVIGDAFVSAQLVLLRSLKLIDGGQ